MRKHYRFLWLEGIFDENTVNSFASISPAANFWQRGFVDTLLKLGNKVDVIGLPVERVWPFGRLSIRGEMASLPPGLTGTIIGYINAPFLRDTVQYINYLKAAKRYLNASENIPDYLITFSCLDKPTDETPSIRTAKYIRRHFGVPWICVVADGAAPPGADGYVYLAWSCYQSEVTLSPSIHIDGGVPDIKLVGEKNTWINHHPQGKVLMYMGALTQHGGCTQLARAFHALRDSNIRLWICGRGNSTELTRLAEIDQRIIVKGFVGEHELNKLAASAFAFANPRPSSFVPNKFNYPSKILHYLAYGKPIISTFTDSLCPDYAEVLIPIREGTDDYLGEAIYSVLNMGEDEYEAVCARIAIFNKTHTWQYQINRFISWLQP